MEYKSFSPERVAAKADLDNGIIDIYASTFGVVDDGGDIMEPGAFANTIRNHGSRVKTFVQHWEPIGRPVELREVGRDELPEELRLPNVSGGLFSRNKISPTTSGKDVLILVRDGVLSEASIGYDPIRFEYDDRGYRHLKEVRLWEVSVCTWGMNSVTLSQAKRRSMALWGMPPVESKAVVPFQDLPLADDDQEWDAAAATGRVRRWAGGPEKEEIDWGKYRKAFLLYDPDDSENYRAYKLPIADVIDGRLKAVPRGIFAAAAVLMGARGGVEEFDEGDIEKAKRHLARYYEKMDREPPWAGEEAGLLPLYQVLGWAWAQEELKEGRVLSTANRRLVEQAIEALQALLAASDGSDGDEGDKSGQSDVTVTELIEELRRLREVI
ncbi:MAG: HK97 family phage prohead protease [Pigmentiphaga sp.]